MTATKQAVQERAHMRRALELAERGRGRVSPNPLVGAVLASGDSVLGEGWHAEVGGAHAEVAALSDARERGARIEGATLYVTLEPCAHHGRTPPCTDAILSAGVSCVVVASDDPSEKASGRGPGILRDEGVEVCFASGSEAAAARLLNQPFRKHARTGAPHVLLKSAVSLDGRVATRTGDSRWISGPQSRELVHRWRAETDAICVGIGTALADDPMLTARGDDPRPARQPLRVVFDSGARLPLESRLVASAGDSPVLVVAAGDVPPDRVQGLSSAGVEVLAPPGSEVERITAALAELGRRGVTALLLEGGPGLAGAFLDADEIDEVRLFVAPVLIGGADSPALVDGRGAERLEAARRALEMTSERSGDDLLLRARMREW